MINQLRTIENGYMKLFCNSRDLQDRVVFTNEIVPELYDHAFIFIQNIQSEVTILNFLSNELQALEDSKGVHLKIVFHPQLNLSQELHNIMEQRGFEVDELYYMLYHGTVSEEWVLEGSCLVEKAVTDTEIQMGVDCAIAYASQRMPLLLATKKINQKKELYKKGLLDLYVCSVDGVPIGFCDWYEEDGIIKLEEVTILPEFKGRGFGTEMLKQLLYKGIREEQKQVYVVTETGDEHNLYQQLGFQTVGMETEMFYFK